MTVEEQIQELRDNAHQLLGNIIKTSKGFLDCKQQLEKLGCTVKFHFAKDALVVTHASGEEFVYDELWSVSGSVG